MMSLDNLIQPIWDLTPYPICLIDFHPDPAKRKFAYVNPAFTTLTGYGDTDAIGSPAAILNGPHTTLAAIRESELGIAAGKAATTPIVHYRKDGSAYAAHMTIAPLVEADGETNYLIMVETMLTPMSRPAASRGDARKDGAVPLHLPMPLKEFPRGDLPSHLVSRPELDEIRAIWTELRGNGPLPPRSGFTLRIVAKWAAHLSIATTTLNGRYRFSLFGSELARVYGQDLTGRFLDELTPRDLWSVITLHYDEVVGTRQPLFAPISIANGHWYTEVSRLLLPFAADDGDAATVAYVIAIDYTRY
jgi:PAS domain S-box-containing protein